MLDLEAVAHGAGVSRGSIEMDGLQRGYRDAQSAANVGRLPDARPVVPREFEAIEKFLRTEESLQAAPPDDLLR